jgi:RNA polymerase sigma-70 factor (ECF subfamily)
MIQDPPEISSISARLLAGARAGNRDAYDQLFSLAADRVLLYIRMRLKPPLREKVDALDVLQDTYLEAHRSFRRFEYRGPGSFSAWLCRIAERALAGLADHHGALKRRPPGSRVAISRVLDRIQDSGAGPGSIAARREELEKLERALAELPGDERRALLLRHFQEETIESIAKTLEMSPTSARRLLGRAMARLGELLAAGGVR